MSATFSEAVQSGTIGFVLRDSSGNVVPSSVSYNSSNFVATLTPNSPLAFSTAYTATLGGAKDLAGNTMSTVSWSFTTVAQATTTTIWPSSATPAIPAATDSSSVELGVKFKSDTAGYITGIRFYKGTGNTGTHLGNLWDSSGHRLATATFASESSSGWQQVNFATPVAIAANTVYVASYFAPAGHYAYTQSTFASSGVEQRTPPRAVRHRLRWQRGLCLRLQQLVPQPDLEREPTTGSTSSSAPRRRRPPRWQASRRRRPDSHP